MASEQEQLLPLGIQEDENFAPDLRLGSTGSLEEIQAYLISINYEINHLLMLNTIATCHNRANVVRWILENTHFDKEPERNHQYYIMRFIVLNNSVDVLRVCLENETMRNILKTSQEIQTQISHFPGRDDRIIEEYIGTLDLAIVDAAEARHPELALALYPHVSSTTYEIFPYSVKHTVLIRAIFEYSDSKSPQWMTLCQTILDDESYDPSNPHSNEPLNIAVQLNSVIHVKHMLNHPRITICEYTSDEDLMTEVCEYANTPDGLEVFKLFLNDARINPSRDANHIIHDLTRKGAEYNAALRHAMTCERIRWDWFGWPTPLTTCVSNQNIEGVRILLSEPRYDPCMRENEAVLAAEEIMEASPEIMLELLGDERIARTYGGKGVLLKAHTIGKRLAGIKEELELAAMTPERIWKWYLTEDAKQSINVLMKP
jgi:hypothetical protein